MTYVINIFNESSSRWLCTQILLSKLLRINSPSTLIPITFEEPGKQETPGDVTQKDEICTARSTSLGLLPPTSCSTVYLTIACMSDEGSHWCEIDWAGETTGDVLVIDETKLSAAKTPKSRKCKRQLFSITSAEIEACGWRSWIRQAKDWKAG